MTHRIWISEDSDVDSLAAEFRQQLRGTELSEQARATLMEQVTQTLRMLADQGRKVAAMGNSTRASREIEIAGYRVRIEAAFGTRPSLWERLKALAGRQR